MSSRRRKRMLRIWEQMVQIAKWCERHGLTKLLCKVVLKAILWFLEHD